MHGTRRHLSPIDRPTDSQPAAPAAGRPRLLLHRPALALLWALAAQPLLGRTPEGHDTLLHLYRIPVLASLWREGILFARWAPDLLLGYGYPLFHYYPPLSAYLLTALYFLVGEHAPLAMGLAFALAFGAAAAGMYRLARGLYGGAEGSGRIAATLASAAYVLSPHLLYQTYERGSLSNALAMALVPWALHALLGVARSPERRRIAAAGLALALLLASHAGSSLVLAPALGVLGLLGAWAAAGTRRERAHRALGVVGALALGLGMAAFYWLPALRETDLVRYAASIASPDVHWSQHFADVLALPPAAVDGLANPALPITVGVGPLMLGMAGAACALWRAERSAVRRTRVDGADLLAAGAGVLAVGALLLASPASTGLWERSALVRNLQFPWRALDPAALLLALAAGALLRPRPAGPVASRARPIALAAVIAVLYLGALPYLTPPRFTTLPERPTLAQASRYQQEYGAWGLTSWGEYLPIAVREAPSEPAVPGVEGSASLAAKARTAALPGEVLSSSGGGLRATLRVRLRQPADLTLATYWFPGWQADLDGQPLLTCADAEGLLTVSLPAGEHRVTIRWAETPLRAAADRVSAVAVLAALALAAWPRRRARADQPGSVESPEPAAPGGAAERPAAWNVALALVLASLLAGKALVLDRAATPLLRRAEQGALAGTEQPPYRTFADALTLVGYEQTAPGRLTLYWQAQRDLDRDYTIEVIAKSPRGDHLARVEQTHPGLSLTSRWQAGRLVRDAYEIPLGDLDRPAALGYYVSVRDASTGEALAVVDSPDGAQTEVPCGRARLPADAVSLGPDLDVVEATFGGVVELEAARLPDSAERGQPIELTLRWRSVAATDVDYTVFVHVTDAAGIQVAAADAQPRDGLYPTSWWEPGETVIDVHTLAPDLPAGVYRIEIGLYDLATMERLPVVHGGTATGDTLAIGELPVTP